MSTSRIRILARALVKNPKYLTINRGRISQISMALKDLGLAIPRWDFKDLYPQSDDFEEMCLFYFLFNATNYCYFDQYGNKFKRQALSGSSLAAKCYLDRWEEIKDPLFLVSVDENYLLTTLFDAEIPISLVKERTAALRELGKFLLSNLDFTFDRLFSKYRRNAYFVSQTLTQHLPSWSDPFFKRTQLFVGMVAGRFQDEEIFVPESLNDLTVFADYKVPQTLLNLGLILPSEELEKHLRGKLLIPSGSLMELELRAASVVVADLILADLHRFTNDPNLNCLHVDYALWGALRNTELVNRFELHFPTYPHHLTMTTDY